MATVADGLEVEGQRVGSSGDVNSDSGFNAALAAQARAEHSAPAATAPAPDVSQQSAEEIVGALIVDEPGTDVASGVTVAGGVNRWGMSPEEQARVHADYLELERSGTFDEGARASAAARQESQRVRELEEQLAAAQFELTDIATDYDEAVALAQLRRNVSPSTFEAYLERAAYEGLGLDPEDDLDYEDLDAVEERLSELRGAVDEIGGDIERHLAAERLHEATDMINRLTAHQAKEAVAERKTYLNDWARENGLSTAEARRRIEAAEMYARELLGVELATIPRTEDFVHHFRAAVATVEESVRAQRERAFQQSVLDTPSTAISSGIEQFGPMGWVRLDQAILPEAAPNPEQVARRAIRERLNADGLRHALIASESTSVKDGLTVNGRPTTVDEATGARERVERERQEARMRDMSGL